MTIEVDNEKTLSFSHAAKSLPNRPHVSTIHRWRVRGVRGVKLEALLIGGKWHTSIDALQRFFERCTAAANGTSNCRPVRADRSIDIERAEKELADAGI